MKTTERAKAYMATCDARRLQLALVAEALNISHRTLARRLKQDGTRFSDMVDAERARRCEDALKSNREARGKRLADVCGYDQQNSFFRAFSRWHGVNFLEYKRDNFL